MRGLVLDHHERLDGRATRAASTASSSTSTTRILAVCDVYDALVSTASTATAWSPERALALLRDEAARSTPGCVAALDRVLAHDLAEEPAAA